MQKRTRVLALLLAVPVACAIIYGCKKSFIDRRPIGQYTIENYFTTDERAFQGVVGVYDVLGWNRTFDKMFWSLGDGGSDDTPIGLNRDDGSPPYVGINPVVDYTNVSAAKLSPAMENVYKGFYEGVYRANVVIAALEKSTIDQAKIDRYIAEVKTLRAIYYFMLVNYYGGVPLYTTAINPGDESSVSMAKATVREVYDLIEGDLVASVAALPTKGQTVSENMTGRITKGAALTLLAKAYLFDKKYTEAAAAAQQVINLGEYSLNNDYYANFMQGTSNGVESIWEIMRAENYTDNGGGWGADSFDGTGTPVAVGCGGWGQNSPSGDLFNQFETNDIRRQYTATLTTDVLQGVQMCGTPEAPGMAKHVIPGKAEGDFPRSDVIALNWVLFRYADVLLMKSEALAAAATATATAPVDAVSALMEVRGRAGLTSPTTVEFQAYTAEQLLRYVRSERRRELGMEAWRLFDLRRWGADSTRNALIRVGKINTTDRPWNDAYLLYPFPQAEVELSKGALVQNPGY
ncbi:MAG: RagB/SusD family nutrient uptake outer membrane protein [Chitinophagaceae bacterium]